MNKKTKIKNNNLQSSFSHPLLKKEEVESLWKQEIARLEGQKFSSLEQAVSCITELVLMRLNLSTQDKELREYLEFLLISDPILIKQIAVL